MKIDQQHGNGLSTERSERSEQAGRLGSETRANGARSRQVGLDRVEVSHVAETAASLIENTMRQRQDRVAALASRFQSGTYSPNLANLAQSILDHDLESDPSYAG